MNAVDRKRFLARISPFDRLSEVELERVSETLDVRHYPPGGTLLEAGGVPTHLHIIIKGTVQELSDEGVVSLYSAEDGFDARSVLEGRNQHRFVAAEETSCFLLPRDVLLDLTQHNARLASFYVENISQRLDALIEQENNKELASFMVAKIRDAYIHPPLFVPAETSIHDAAVTMKQNKATSLLVRHGTRIGIVTGMDLREAAIIARRSVDSPVGDIASYDLISMKPDDFLFNALLLMTRHTISRVVIRDAEQITGVLEQIDLLSYFSNHSRLIAIQIERATSKQNLQGASLGLIRVIQALHAKGVKTRYITQLVAELNKKIFNKLYQLLAPPALIANSCLLVMGSEGREEQILKTDQDNAIILRDGFACPQLEGITGEFTDTLMDFGYPRCPGNIMVSNPYWAKPLKAYKDELFQWITHPDEESFMRFAIFFDAMAVAGDASLLRQARDYMFGLLNDNSAFYSKFARPTVAFETPLGFFANFVVEKHEHRDELDIKKGGIFPIVHGIRSLSLEHRLAQANTIERIKALNGRGLFDQKFAVELIEAFSFICALRLKAGLQKIAQGLPQDNYLNPKGLNKLERELLRDSFKIVNEFKKLISYHFKLNMVG